MSTAIPPNEVNETASLERLFDVSEESLCTLLPIQGHEKVPLVSLEEATKPLMDNNIVSDIPRMVYVAKEKCKQPGDGLTCDESAAIMLYTIEWKPREKCLFYALNECLREPERNGLEPWYLFLKLLLTALNKLPTLSKRVYRGVKMDLSSRYQLNSTFIWWGFSSCATNISTLQSESFLGKLGDRTMFAIECHSGKDIRAHSFYKNENEILLPPARQFTVEGFFDSGNGLRLIQLKETTPQFAMIELVQDAQVNTQSSISNRNSKLDSIVERCQLSKRVEIKSISLTDEDIPTIVNELIMSKECTDLDLTNNQITSSGVLILASALEKNTTLKVLSLLNNRVCDIGILKLAGSLAKNNSTLTVLGLGSNDITDEGAEYLANMLQSNQTLIRLDLQNNRISSRGVQALMETLARANKTLTTLNICSNRSINDDCVDSVIKMIKFNQTLKECFMGKCNISSTGIKQIEKERELKRYPIIRF